MSLIKGILGLFNKFPLQTLLYLLNSPVTLCIRRDEVVLNYLRIFIHTTHMSILWKKNQQEYAKHADIQVNQIDLNENRQISS